MVKAFISYNRGDDDAITGRIRDRLERKLGNENVFMDVYDMKAGDFSRQIEDALRKCRIELVVIGRRWQEHGPGRWVQREVEMALQLDLSVIPVLVDGMPIPTEDDQPEFLRKLSRLQAFRVRSNGHDFDHDMDNIISAIETAINRPVEAKTIVYRSHADALVAAVKLLKDLPPLAPGEAAPPVEMTVQGTTVFKSISSIHKMWKDARIAALRNGWRIRPYWRLNKDHSPPAQNRTVQWVLDMFDVLKEGNGTSKYEPWYFESESDSVDGLLRAPYEVLLIPAFRGEPAKAMLLFATTNEDHVDAALYTEDPVLFNMWSQHLRMLTAGSVHELFKQYQSSQRTNFLQDMESLEQQGAGRLLFKPDLSVLTLPPEFYTAETPWARRADLEGFPPNALSAQQRRRVDGLRAARSKNSAVLYRDICSKAALREWVRTRTYSAYQSVHSQLVVDFSWIRKHLANAIRLLEQNSNYQIALLEDEDTATLLPHGSESITASPLWMVAGQGNQQAAFMQILKQSEDGILSTRDLACYESRVVNAFREYFLAFWRREIAPIEINQDKVKSWLREVLAAIPTG